MGTFKAFLVTTVLCLTPACSPRDYLTRRLATDLISASDAFRAPQVFWLKTGMVSNKDFNAPDSLVLQRRGWIIGTQQKCPPGIDPAPCWDIVLSPHGVDTFRSLISESTHGGTLMPIQVAQREMGSALYDSGVRYRSTVGFRSYDDGWRVQTEPLHNNQPIDDALRTAQPAP
jgi:hypothetical protein